MKKTFIPLLAITLFATLAVTGLTWAVFTPPASSPPAGNTDPPLNISNVLQEKIGPLIINSGGAINGLIVDQGNVGIGTISPAGALDVTSTTGGFVVPRMTTAQRDALSAVNGTIIYNTSTNQFDFYENGIWVQK